MREREGGKLLRLGKGMEGGTRRKEKEGERVWREGWKERGTGGKGEVQRRVRNVDVSVARGMKYCSGVSLWIKGTRRNFAMRVLSSSEL